MPVNGSQSESDMLRSRGSGKEAVSGGRVPLKVVVADCERRWFEATLKGARSGDATMQYLVGQMFCSGYGVASDMKKGKLWLKKSAGANEDVFKELARLSVGGALNIKDVHSEAHPNESKRSVHV